MLHGVNRRKRAGLTDEYWVNNHSILSFISKLKMFLTLINN